MLLKFIIISFSNINLHLHIILINVLSTLYMYLYQFFIKNFNNKVYGLATMTNVLEESINTGTIWAMQVTTPKVFSQYVKDFGFGQKTGIQIDFEASGDISNLDRSGEIYAATASYGHGIVVTPLQMVSAISAIANNGKLQNWFIIIKNTNYF